MEVSIILDNTLVKNYSFTRDRKNLVTLDNYIEKYKNLNGGELKKIDNWIGNIKRNNKTLYKTLVFSIALLNYSFVVFADVTDTYSRLDKVGYLMLGVLKKVGFWICLLCCFIEILKSFLNSDIKDVWKIFFKYVSVFLILHSLPYAFDLIAGVFEDL